MSIHAGVRIGRSNTDDPQGVPENRSEREIPAAGEPPENGVPAHALTQTAVLRASTRSIGGVALFEQPIAVCPERRVLVIPLPVVEPRDTEHA